MLGHDTLFRQMASLMPKKCTSHSGTSRHVHVHLYLSEEDAKEVIEKIASDVISEGANPQATQVISALKG